MASFIHGAMSLNQAESSWPTRIKDNSRSRIRVKIKLPVSRPLNRFPECLRPLRHGGQRLAVVQRLVSARLFSTTGRIRQRRAKSARSGKALRSRRAVGEKARPQRRFLPLHRSILHPLHGWHTRQGRSQHGHEPPRISLRAGAMILRVEIAKLHGCCVRCVSEKFFPRI